MSKVRPGNAVTTIMNTITRKARMTALAVAASLAVASSSTTFGAALRLSDGTPGGTVVIVDQGPGDGNPQVGVVSYVGPVGINWIFNGTAGVTKPANGGPAQPFIDIGTTDLSLGLGDLTIEFTETDFTAAGFVEEHMGGTTPGNVTSKYWVDYANQPFGETTLLSTIGPLIGPSFHGDSAIGTIGAGPYSLTVQAIISHPASGVTTLDTEIIVTPAANGCPGCTTTWTGNPTLSICSDATSVPGLSASEDCGQGPTPLAAGYVDSAPVGTCPAVFTRTWTVTNSCGSTSTSNQVITVNCKPSCSLSAPDTLPVCGSSGNTLSGPAGMATYVWSVTGTGWLINASDVNSQNIHYTAGTGPATFFLHIVDTNGCANDCQVSFSCTPECACTPHDIKYNFNGTQIIFQPTTQGYVWFTSDGKITGVPQNQVTTLYIFDQVITIPQTASTPQFTLPVPDSVITFDPAATIATTTFDTVNDLWRMTFPVSGLSGNLFYGALAFPVPAGGLPGGIKNVDWSGKFSTATPGMSIAWQWHGAAYSKFTTDYNALKVKPSDDTSKTIYKNSDHAGVPEGADSGGKLWKSYVVGGASGGGGANYTGSGSSTITFPPCICP